MKTSSLFIWHIIYFFTMDGFFRIFENTLSELICTRLYGWIRRQDSGEYSVRVPAGPCRLIFFKICPFSAEFHITGIYSIYKYLAKIMLLKENLPFMAEFFYSHQKLRKEQAKKRRLITNDLNKSAAMETTEKRIEKKSRFPTSFCQLYNCVLYEKSNKFSCYCKIERKFSTLWMSFSVFMMLPDQF